MRLVSDLFCHWLEPNRSVTVLRIYCASDGLRFIEFFYNDSFDWNWWFWDARFLKRVMLCWQNLITKRLESQKFGSKILQKRWTHYLLQLVSSSKLEELGNSLIQIYDHLLKQFKIHPSKCETRKCSIKRFIRRSIFDHENLCHLEQNIHTVYSTWFDKAIISFSLNCSTETTGWAGQKAGLLSVL